MADKPETKKKLPGVVCAIRVPTATRDAYKAAAKAQGLSQAKWLIGAAAARLKAEGVAVDEE